MNRYLCVHGHFYQPPRENPKTGEVPVERDAAPFHDFNEKILAECYRPNAEQGNFDRLNFDIGPTLGDWMRKHHPDVLSRITESDRTAVRELGFGNAVMQSYHHTILPLASERDRRTELRWGIRWFEHVFGRRPKGIWLPETAVDYPTLEACVDEGFEFTILSPEQADDPALDTRAGYRVELPSRRTIAAFFYEGPLSGTISFDPAATDSAAEFIRRFVLPRYEMSSGEQSESPLVLVASDGEVYGHHHKFKDRFLHDLLFVRTESENVVPVSLEKYLEMEPPKRSVKIRERSSWGCPHQLLRWRGNCGCTEGDGTWKAGLRSAFDQLAARIDQFTEAKADGIISDVWALRDGYVDVLTGATAMGDWLSQHGIDQESRSAMVIDTLLQAQRYRLAMYASCAFYWDDLTRIEAGYGVRSGMYAAALLDEAFGTEFQQSFKDDLASVVGWKSGRSAAELYEMSAAKE